MGMDPQDFPKSDEKKSKLVSVKQQVSDSASRKSTAQVPCTESDRKNILNDVALLKSLIEEEKVRQESGDDILGTIVIGQLYEDKAVKAEGELLEKNAKTLRRITAKLMSNKKFKKALTTRKIGRMIPKTLDQLLDLIPDTEEFNCLVDQKLKFQREQAQKEKKTQTLSKEDTGPLLTADFYQSEQQTGRRGGKHKRKTNKRKTNKRKTRRY
jgi:hypothetical protein